LIKNITDDITTVTVSGTILYSGKNVNDIGDYDACNKNIDNEYVLLNGTFKYQGKTPSLFIGLCVPKGCED
jgi:hypothetical protein